MQLKDRIAVITGASAGIGRAIAQMFAAEGAHVIIVARSMSKLEELRSQIESSGGSATIEIADVSAEDQVEAVFGRCRERFGRVDVLVNNAGVTTRSATDELPLAEWKRVMDINVTGAFLCARAALRVMKPHKSGKIINIGSLAVKSPRPNSAAYTTSKFALEGLTKSLAVDGREFGITACVIHLGNTQSEFWRGREELATREGIMPADQVARVATFVASMPPDINIFETVVHPSRMSWIGRG